MKLYLFQKDVVPHWSGKKYPYIYLNHLATDKKIEICIAYDSNSQADLHLTQSVGSIGEIDLVIYPELKLLVDWDEIVVDRGSNDRQFWCYVLDLFTPLQNIIIAGISGFIPYYRSAAGHKYPSRMGLPRINRVLELLSISSPFHNSEFQDCLLTVTAKDIILAGDSFEVVTDMPFEFAHDLREAWLPTIRLTATGDLTPTQYTTVRVEVVNSDGDLYGGDLEVFFEAVNGQLSHNRRTTVNGEAWTRVSAPNMDIGDTVRVKAGSKYVSGLDELTLTVVSD